MDSARLRRCALLLVAAHIVLSTLYSLVVPLWESYDEWGHYVYIQYVANHFAPPPAGGPLILPADETKQPPLYYLLTGLPTFWLLPREPLQIHRNPYGIDGHGGENVAVHGADEVFPFSGVAVGVHLVRAFDAALSGLGVWCTFLLARLLFPRQPAIVLAATALHAFAPEFLFMSAVVNNDGLAITLSSLVLHLTVRALLRPERARDLLWPFAALVLGAETKFNVVAFAPAVLLGVGIGAQRLARARGWRMSRHALAGIGAGGVAFIAAGALYLRELGARQTLDVPVLTLLQQLPLLILDPLSPAFGWQVLPAAFDNGFITFWAAFGWGNIVAPGNIYTALSALCWLSVLGLAMGAVRFFSAEQRAGLAWLALALAGIIAAAAYFALAGRYAYALSGRYLLTALSAVSVLIAAGVAGLCPARLRAPALCLVALGFGWWGLSTPFDAIMPVYAPPPTVAAAQAGSLPNSMQAQFGDALELLGYELHGDEVLQGGALPVTLYWRLLKPTAVDYTVGLRLTGSGKQPVGGVDFYPGGGNYATSLWTPGTIVKDDYTIPAQDAVDGQDTGRLVITLYPGESGKPLPVIRTDEPPRHAVTVGRFRLLSRAGAAPPSHPALLTLGSAVELAGYDVAARDGSVGLKLYWRAQRAPADDYTVFVHLMYGERIVAQHDHQPREGRFPTSLWRPGDLVVDETELTVPAEMDLSRLQLWTGMYRAATLERLAVLDTDGRRLPDDRILLAWH